MVTRNNIRQELSSAYHHESNGHTECAVREIKKLLARYDGLSPAQWYFERGQRTEAVALPLAYECNPDQIVDEHELQRQRKTYKLRTHANKSSWPKPQLHVGQPVIAQHVLTKRWDQRGER